jgi:amino acid adenylation domain-containing protein
MAASSTQLIAKPKMCGDEVTLPSSLCVHELFEIQAAKTPDALAVWSVAKSVTYRQLNESSNRLAWRLRSLGVKRGTSVAICLERSVDLVVAIYAVLKSGGVYVPVDPSYPERQRAHMLDSAGALCTIAHSNVTGVALHPSDAENLAFSTENPPSLAGYKDLIYTIFTSGSTGRSKGASVYHQGFSNLLHWFVKQFAFSHQDRVLLVSSTSFDLTQKNFFAPLVAGGSLFLLPEGPYDPIRIRELVSTHGITSLNCTPSAVYPIVECAESSLRLLRSIRLLFLGGEPINSGRLTAWTKSPVFHAEIVNTYGPTECSDICAFHRLGAEDFEQGAVVPVGLPIFNTRLAILRDDFTECQEGETGELCIAGAGVGAGYLSDPVLTREKFVNNPLPGPFAGGKMYRTGDLMRLRPAAGLEFVGRVDNQVKIRGIRIEPGEVEAVMLQHPSLKEAVVMGRDGGNQQKVLVGYFVIRPDLTLDVTELRGFLKDRLPAHLVPSVLVPLSAFPLSPNGKVDRHALPDPSEAKASAGTSAGPDESRRSPGFELEEAVSKVWSSVLQVEDPPTDQNFFDLGGDSLRAISVHRMLSKVMPGAAPSVTVLFQYPTIDSLCGYLRSRL